MSQSLKICDSIALSSAPAKNAYIRHNFFIYSLNPIELPLIKIVLKKMTILMSGDSMGFGEIMRILVL